MLRRLGSTLAGLWLAIVVSLGSYPVQQAEASQGSLCMPLVSPVSGLVFSQNVNAALAALVSENSGATAPTNPCGGVPVAGQSWLDTSTAPNTAKVYDGTNWEVLGYRDAVTGVWTPVVGGGDITATVASASTADLWTVPQSFVNVSGTVTITRLAGSGALQGTHKFVRFTGVMTLTYDATHLILPSGGTNVTTANGDTAEVVALGSSNVLILNYQTAAGLPASLSNVNNTSDANKPVSTAQAAAILVAQTQSVNWNSQSASYTLVLGDAGKLVTVNNASANTITVPLNSSVAYPLNTRIDLGSYGVGQTSVVATGGVTIRSAGGKLKLSVRYSGGTLIKIGTDEWWLFGDLAT